jgi:hypothetical protein
METAMSGPKTPDGPLEDQLRRARVELGRRLRAGEPCSAEALLAVHPALAADVEAALV